MHTMSCRWVLCTSLTILGAATLLSGCSKPEGTPTASTASTSPGQATVPPPPGDSTPKAADSSTRQAMENNEHTSGKAQQSTVGTAASGAPPYTLNGAPEGNTAPSQGTKSGESAKQ